MERVDDRANNATAVKTGEHWLHRLKKAGIRTGIAIVAVLVLARVLPVDTDIAFAHVVEARDSTVLHAYLSTDRQWRMFTRLDEITPELRKAIVYKEDKHFYHHLGVNPLAVGRAMVNNIFHLKRTSGASTITMQVARMLDPKQRSYFNKCLEMFCALQLEMKYSKEEILQMYLNLVPYGSNIAGVKAASLLYFNKTPDHLSLAEITALSIIPNRPNSLVIGKDNERIIKQRNKWLQRFENDGLFASGIINDALHEPLTAYRHSAPCSVPQFARRVKGMNPTALALRTTLDNKIQQQAEGIITNYVNQLKLHNINNASVLIVDNKTHEVLAYIGSSDFGDKANFGQVDGVKALRSPGSTLKPLLYGLCMDKGIIAPRTMIADVPINIKGYSPENYDKTFNGNVTAEYALSHSLNIPAVKLLEDEGVTNFANVLGKAGFNSISKSKNKIGLSLILGGCGVRLDEMTALYSSFANDGQYYPLQFTMADKRDSTAKSKYDTLAKGITILSQPANYMLTHILSELHRPDLPNAYDEAQGIPRIAWKTGTSYGRKDAWSIGYNKRYTIGVWLGNFSAAGVQELSGASTATPLLFQLFNAIDHNAANEWVEPPNSIGFRLVCKETGKLPGDNCPDQVMDHYIPGVTTCQRCDHLAQTWISADEKYSYCTYCLPPNGYKTKLLPNIAPELASFYKSSNISFVERPQHNPACTHTLQGRGPIITSLTNGMTYIIENKAEQKLQLSCTVSNDVKKVYWYINDQFYAAAETNQKIFCPANTPVLKISCSDDKGRNTNIEVKVRFM